ncbi:hypothetical protein AERO8C_140029 [Aeromonas veronii]|uniref:Uncharacterized protein n=1 Tax=Aeromonas veronii TaxID=654 RepID=A0A653KST6_AERVE|nr:hypothetical protein AERO8C_140029 [Aeromonas veronii]
MPQRAPELAPFSFLSWQRPMHSHTRTAYQWSVPHFHSDTALARLSCVKNDSALFTVYKTSIYWMHTQ